MSFCGTVEPPFYVVDHGTGHLRVAGSHCLNEFGHLIEDGNYVAGAFCMDVVDGEFTYALTQTPVSIGNSPPNVKQTKPAASASGRNP